MRFKHFLRLVVSSTTVTALTSIIPSSLLGQTGEVQLEAHLEPQAKQIHVALRNNGENTYLMQIGGICGTRGTPGFRFTLRRTGREDQALYLDYNSVGIACGNPAPWMTVLPKRSTYGFQFTLQELRLSPRPGSSMADVKDSHYTIIVTYRVKPDRLFLSNLTPCAPKDIPLWTGELSASTSK